MIIKDQQDAAEKEKFGYTDELVWTMTDFWHTEESQLLEGLLSKDFRWMGDPQSILFNGKGERFEGCVDHSSGCSLPCPVHPVLLVQRNTTYRVRLISASQLSFFILTVGGLPLRLIAADGVPINPITSSFIEINAGQRYDFLLTTSSDKAISYHPINIDTRFHHSLFSLYLLGLRNRASQHRIINRARGKKRWRPSGLNLTVILAYPEFNQRKLDSKSLEFLPMPEDSWSWDFSSQIKGHQDLWGEPVPDFDTELVIRASQQKKSDELSLRWYLNDQSLLHPEDGAVPLVEKAYLPDGDVENAIVGMAIQPRDSRVLQLIFQNTINRNGICEQHPWHIHGSVFLSRISRFDKE